MHYYIEVFKKYAVFQGRARRAEYWYFYLFNSIACVILAVIDYLLHIPFLFILYELGIIVPSIAVSVRRLHDTGRSGWWFFLKLIPIVGFIIVLIWFIMDSEPGANQYGPNPKGVQGPSVGQPVSSVA